MQRLLKVIEDVLGKYNQQLKQNPVSFGIFL